MLNVYLFFWYEEENKVATDRKEYRKHCYYYYYQSKVNATTIRIFFSKKKIYSMIHLFVCLSISSFAINSFYCCFNCWLKPERKKKLKRKEKKDFKVKKITSFPKSDCKKKFRELFCRIAIAIGVLRTTTTLPLFDMREFCVFFSFCFIKMS